MEKRLMFTRKFSEIPKLQENHEYRYYVLWEAQTGQYGIQIDEFGNESVVYGETAYFTNDRELAETLLLYLYENSVSRTLVNDLLRDLKVTNSI